jgi:Ca2+-binding RTX toxin-like protein
LTDFLGTSEDDSLVGADGVEDTFFFRPNYLSATDTVTGGGAAERDTLHLTRNGDVLAGQLAGVSGIEQVVLYGNSAFALTFNMLDTAFGRTIFVVGSSTNDTIDGSLATSSDMHIAFAAGDGVDAFIGGSGADDVFIGAGQLTIADSFSGGAGADLLRINSPGALAADALTNVSGFEKINLEGGTNSLTLLTSNLTSAGGRVKVEGSAGDDVVDAGSVTSGKVSFKSGDGNNIFTGGAGQNRALGGGGLDTFHGGSGVDSFNGRGGDDHLDGGAGFDFFHGGGGHDTIVGGDGGDVIRIVGFSAGIDDIVFNFESEGGDSVKGAGRFADVYEGSFHLYFTQGGGDFDTNGAFDFEVFDDGTTHVGPGGPTDGADAVFYNGNGGGGGNLGSAAAVDAYFAERYFAADDVGAFLTEKNADGSVSVYYDADAHTDASGVVALVHIRDYNGSFAALMDYFDAI